MGPWLKIEHGASARAPNQSGQDLHGKTVRAIMPLRLHVNPSAGQILPHPCLPHGRRSFFPACYACAFVVLLLPYFGRPYGGDAMELVSILTYRRRPSLYASGLNLTYCKWSAAMQKWCLQLVAIHVSTVRLAYHTLKSAKGPQLRFPRNEDSLCIQRGKPWNGGDSRRNAAARLAILCFLLQTLTIPVNRRDASVFPSSLYPLVAVLIKCGKILPKLPVCLRHRVSLPQRRKLDCQHSQSFRVELVLMRLRLRQC